MAKSMKKRYRQKIEDDEIKEVAKKDKMEIVISHQNELKNYRNVKVAEYNRNNRKKDDIRA